jgi:hypothetical protein
MRPRGGAQLRVDDAGLDDRQLVVAIDAQNAIQPRQHEEHSSLIRERATREASPRAARHERDAVRGEQSNDGNQFFTSAWQDDEIGNAAMSGETVHRVCNTLGTSLTDVPLSDNGGQVGGQVRKRGHAIY